MKTEKYVYGLSFVLFLLSIYVYKIREDKQCSEYNFLYHKFNNNHKEEEYSLDIYSLNLYHIYIQQMSDSAFVKDSSKWYINCKDDSLTITNESMVIDYDRLLKISKCKNISYIVNVTECPPDKPYIIFSTLQCVSSCSSPDLIEYGIFMTKKLYLYNNICYDICPNGSIPEDINSTCIEINEYPYRNKTYSKEYYEEIRDSFRKIRTLGDSFDEEDFVAEETAEFTINTNFRIYHLKYNEDEEKINELQKLKFPIYDFSQCFNKLIEKYHFNQSESKNIYMEIIENNDINSKINSSSYKFFKGNGEILDHSGCTNISMIVNKSVNFDENDISLLRSLSLNNVDIKDINNNTNKYCKPLVINDTDVTNIQRKKIVNYTQQFCDEGCIFINFNLINNYSTCECKMQEENNTIIRQMNETFMNSEIMEKMMQLIEEGNFKYFKCIKDFFNYNIKRNRIMYISFAFNLTYVVLVILFFVKGVYFQFNDIFIQRISDIKKKKPEITICYNNNDNNNNNNDENTDDFNEARKEKNNFCQTYIKFLKHKLIILILFRKEAHKEFDSRIFKLMKMFLFFENFLFLSALLFTDKVIFSINEDSENIIANLIERSFWIIALNPVLDFFISYFFNAPSRLREANTIKNEEDLKKKLYYLSKEYKVKFIIGFIFFFIIHLAVSIFLIIFGIIYSKSQKYFILFYLLTFAVYLFLYLLHFLLITILRTISLCVNSDYFEEIFFKVSVWMAEFL